VFLRDKTCGAHRDWDRLAAEVTHVHEVPGAGHHTIVNEPYVGIWAKKLDSYLDETWTRKEQ